MRCLPLHGSGGESDDDYFGFRLSTVEPSSAAAAATDGVTAAGSSGSNSVAMNSATKCELEALHYLEDSRKDLVMLNSYPTVKQLFLRFNATLPSSAPVERLFSFAGIISRPHRRKIGDRLLEKLLLFRLKTLLKV